MKLSNIIEEFIKEMLAEEDMIELQRNELANKFNCVPSQINYVISTRFCPEKGYIVESKRGGGGYLKIRRVIPDKENLIHSTLLATEDRLTYQDAKIAVDNLFRAGVIDDKMYKLIIGVVSGSSIPDSVKEKDMIRANLLKNILITLL